MNTQWQVVEGFDYEVSNKGQVRNLHTGHILKPYDNCTGYKKVSLRKDGKTHRVYVHRLVAMAFVDGYEEGLTVDHIDACRSNNTADNLQWMTLEDNVKKARQQHKAS